MHVHTVTITLIVSTTVATTDKTIATTNTNLLLFAQLQTITATDTKIMIFLTTQLLLVTIGNYYSNCYSLEVIVIVINSKLY